MEKIRIYGFLLFLFLCKISFAQITFTVITTNVDCSHSSGSIKINVSQAYPPYTYAWSNGEITPNIYNLEPGTYAVTITDALAHDTSATIVIQDMECEMAPAIVFTPNGDGYNDTWDISNYQYFPDALVLVFNRWGQKVYEHSGLYDVPWNGEDLWGGAAPDASYFYIIYKDKKKKKDLKKGSISILR